MIAGLEHAQHIAPPHHGRDWVHAATQCLAQNEQIGCDVVVLIAKHATSSGQTALDLIHDEQDIVFAAKCFSFLQKALWRHPNARLALNRFNDEGGGTRCDGFGQRLGDAIRHGFDTRQQGPEIGFVLWVGRHADQAQRSTMKVALTGDDLAPILRYAFDRFAPFTCQFQRRFDRLGAGVHRQGLVGMGQLRQEVQPRR